MKKILFYASNGVGLGHLRRTALVAQAIKEVSPEIQIFFIILSQKPYFIEKEFLYIPIHRPTDKMLINEPRNRYYRIINKEKVQGIIKSIKPHLIVIDVFLFNFSFPYEIFINRFKNIKKILLARVGDSKNYLNVLKKNKDVLARIDKIIFPHSRQELKNIFSAEDYKKIIKTKKMIIGGSVVKEINKDVLPGLKKKYSISVKNFFLVISLGGGGELLMGDCESPARILRDFLVIYPKIRKAIPNLKAVICVGPLFKHKNELKEIRNKFKNLKIVHFERYLLELMYLSDLVVASAGYNLVNEIIKIRKPAVLVPLRRDSLEQFERAFFLEKRGVVKVYCSKSPSDLFNLIIQSRKNLDNMKKNFNKFNLILGNKQIASLIVKLLNIKR